MKTCEVCGAHAGAEAESCPECGEGSWLVALTAEFVASDPAAVDPAVPAVDQPRPSRRSFGKR